MKINLKLNTKEKYVIGCSFGPDSMALLNAAEKDNLDFVVAHVNYRKRDVSIEEQKALTKYCNERNIKLYVLDLLGVEPIGNFQEWARETRYKFFSEIAKKENASAVLIAHQQDDLIETYLMQKKRGNIVKKWGISVENELFGVKIIRPLLDFSKQELLEYDIQNNIPYSIDQSNLTDHYTRNVFRHSVVEKLSKNERNQIVEEIKTLNLKEDNISLVSTKQEFLSLDYKQIIKFFDYYMTKIGEHRDISKEFVGEIKKALANKGNHFFDITESLRFEQDYDDVFVIDKRKLSGYSQKFINTFKNEFISIDFSLGAEDRGVDTKNKKFIIKNCGKNDTYIIKNYKKSINRLFIDWKMPLYLREVWPGIYADNGDLIYVPRYRKHFEDNHTSKFMIDTQYFCVK